MLLSTQRKLFLLVSLFLVLSVLQSPALWADPDWKSPSDHGFQVNLSTANGIPQKSGQSTQISGQISLVEPIDKHSKQDLRNLVRLLKSDDVQVRAFFPDLTTEVTSEVSIQNNLQFKYTTPSLKLTDQNVFSIQVSRLSKSTQGLQEAQAKIDLRVIGLNLRIQSLSSLNPRPEKFITELKALRDQLQSISSKIGEKLAARNEILAEARFPLQIDNQVAAAQVNSSLIGQFRFSVSYDLGSAIFGERTIAHGSVLRVHPSNHDDEWGKLQNQDPLKINFNWKNALVKTVSGPITSGSAVTFDYPTGKLNPSDQNLFSISLFTNQGSENKPREKLYGALSLILPVANDNTRPTWLAGYTPDGQRPYIQNLQPISLQVQDAFGLIDPSSFQIILSGAQTDGTSVNRNVTSQLQIASPDQGQNYHISGDLNPIPEGLYTFSARALDLAENHANPDPLSVQFRIDRTPPSILLGVQDHILTNQPTLELPITMVDFSPALTTVVLNGTQVSQSSGSLFTTSLALTEGPNFIEVTSIDSAGNSSAPVHLNDIVLDTTPPSILSLTPANNSILNTLGVSIKGKSNEKLSYAKVNSVELALSEDALSFAGSYSFQTQGTQNLRFELADLAGNMTTRDVPVQIFLHVLNGNLLSVLPDTDGSHLLIKGSQSAALPGITVNASASFFNKGSAVSASDGSFAIRMSIFREATVTATDPASDRTDTATVTFGQASGTLLSGVVKDTDGKPLAGATVGIAGSNSSVTTDGSGVFTLTQPVTGDQKLIIDGTTIPPLPPPAPQRSFSRTIISVSIGLSQSNVLERPIYLTPTPLDSSVPVINASEGGSVTHPNAPGVSLEIPANSANFPGQGPSGAVYMASIPSEVATVPPLEFAVPKKVVALEPSGLTFSEPVQLTLPNDNELPPGVELAILSMDSNKGIWEIDGSATVSSDGQKITTKPGQGITHFSLVYAVPLAPVVRPIGSQDQAGADTFNGSLSTSIQLPSFKSLGQSVTPSLVYKSSWAAPGVLLTNLFDIPRQEFKIEGRIINHKYCAYDRDRAIICQYEKTYYNQNLEVEVDDRINLKSWYEPDSIVAQFSSGSVQGAPVTFKNTPEHPIPARSVLSYAMDLIDSQTGQYLDSGIYPYSSHYDIHLKNMIMRTRKVIETRKMHPPAIVYNQTTEQGYALAQVFPSDVNGNIHLQNHVSSPAGRGWRIAGVQKIVNPQNERIMIEEESGSVSDYTIDNTISTVLDGNGHGVDLNLGADLSTWPKAYLSATNGQPILLADLLAGQFQAGLGALPKIDSVVAGSAFFAPQQNGPSLCVSYKYRGQVSPRPMGILSLPGDRVLVADSNLSAVFSLDHGVPSILAGGYTNPRTYGNSPSLFENRVEAYCNSTSGMTCTLTQQTIDYCPIVVYSSSGLVPNPGFNGDGSLSNQLNGPMGIISGFTPNTVIVADTGNNRVRLIDLSNNTISTIAGNGTTNDYGDGGSATSAGIFHPRGLALDSLGNLYISSEAGHIRKVDSTGIISGFAGVIGSNPILSDSTSAHQASFSNPYGMVFDHQRGLMYVADTGHNRVVRIDMTNGTATTVAGNGATGFNGDNQPALAASLTSPTSLGLDPDGNLIVVDAGNQRIRRVIFQNTSIAPLAFSPTQHDLSKLVRNSDGTWIRSYRNGNQVLFDSKGRQTHAKDRVGRQASFTYDSFDRLVSMTDPLGRNISYNYSGTNLSSIVDPAGRTTSFTYDGSNNLIAVAFPDGSHKNYTYDANGLMLSESDPRGNSTQYTYNQWRRLTSVTQPTGSVITINDSGSASASNNYTGGSTGSLKSFGTNELYDSIKDARSVETKFVKNANGFITTIVDGSGGTTTLERNNIAQPTLLTRPDGTQVTFVYDPNTNDLLSQADTATGITTSQTFDAYGNLLTQTNGRGLTSTSQYDPTSGLLVSRRDPLGNQSSFTYNALGLLIGSTNPLGKSISTDYDSAGNVISTTDPLGHTSFLTRDNAGNVISSTNAKNQVTHYEYDSFNRLTVVVTPKLERTEYSYLSSGDLSQIKDAQGNVTTFQYDSAGRMVQKTDPLGFITQRSYDSNSNISQEIDPNGNVKTYTYDTLNQLVQKNLPDNTINLSYDIRNNLTQAKNLHSQVDLTYDVGGRLIKAHSQGLGTYSSLPNVTLGYSYDLSNNRLTMIDPLGTTNYTYDSNERPKSLTNPKGEAYSFSFDAGSRITSIARPGSSSTFTFDDSNMLTSITHSANGSPLSSFSFQRDPIGNLTQIVSGVKTHSLTYDSNNQLTSRTNPEVSTTFQNETFGYDSIFNRSSDQGGSYQYDSKSQRLTEDYKYFYFYDHNGNLASKQAKGLTGEVINYSYSSENQLIGFKAYLPGSTSPVKEVNYAYDALGRRIQKHVIDYTATLDPIKSFTRRFVYDGQEILLDYNENNVILARYTHSGLQTDDVLAVDVKSEGVTAKLAQNAGTYNFLKDHQGTVTDVADISGNKIQHYIYSAFGVLIGIQDASANDVTNNPPLNTSHGFTGRERDSESGMMFYRARYYDPGTGRFLQKDPAPGKLDLPVTVVNSYAYVANNPLNLIDPTGRDIWSTIGDIFAEIAAVVAAVIIGPAVVAALGVTGIFGGILSAAIGAAVGGILGGLVGGIVSHLAKGNFKTGFNSGFNIGLIAGGIAGGLSFLTSGFGIGAIQSSQGAFTSAFLNVPTLGSLTAKSFVGGLVNSLGLASLNPAAALITGGAALVDVTGITCATNPQGGYAQEACHDIFGTPQ